MLLAVRHKWWLSCTTSTSRQILLETQVLGETKRAPPVLVHTLISCFIILGGAAMGCW